MEKTRVLIMGAAGRDFHNFNVRYRSDPRYEVVAFTATQIPNIEGRRYPAELAGSLYPQGIPIHSEDELAELVPKLSVDEVVFAYSDVSHNYVMHRASATIAAGADFKLLGARSTMLAAKVPVVSICAVRTGAGKSQTTRRVRRILTEKGRRVVVVRHPMPYGDLVKQRVQRFSSFEDLDRHDCTIEEREEYQPHLAEGTVVYAGVDYQEILRQAEAECDVLLWDGGNNDLPFYQPTVEIVVADPHRAGHELTYHPGEANLLRAQVIVINKMDSASKEGIQTLRSNIAASNPKAMVIEASSPLSVDDEEMIRGKKVLAIEDGPTITHGGMEFGAATLAAHRFGASELVDPRPHAVGSLRDTFEKYPHLGEALPAMGYGAKQIQELEATINGSEAEVVLFATPVDLRHLVKLDKPALRVRYELQEIGEPNLKDALVSI
ncbi:MAG: cyclic 2,3-diphosphoglycerate synthase [Vicinamibacteria bacterium]